MLFFEGCFLKYKMSAVDFTTRRLWNGIKLGQKRYELNSDLDFVETHLSSTS